MSKESEQKRPSCNTNESEGQDKKNYHKKSTSIFMTVANENMDKIDKYIEILKNLKDLRYILVGKHDGPTLEHYHVYANYRSTKNFNSRDFDYSHLKKVKSPQATIKYIKCQDKKHITKKVSCDVYLEEGDAPAQGTQNFKILQNLSIEEKKELPLNTILALNKVENYFNDLQAVDDWLNNFNLTVEWHMGEPGSGKTYYAKQIGKEYRDKNKSVGIVSFDKNGFTHYLGDDKAELLIINEFRDSNIKFNDFLEILTNEHQFNIKNGNLYLKYVNRIIITTVQNPVLIYRNIREDREQIYRRLTKIYYHVKKNNNYDMFETSITQLCQNLQNEDDNNEMMI